MPLITNLDLMRMEPNLFTDAGGSGLTLLAAGDASVTGDTVTSAGSDFTAAGVGTDHVAVLDGEPVEILAVNDATSMDVSRRRLDATAPTLRPAPGTGLALTVVTFELLIERHEAWALGALAIDPAHPTQPIAVGQVLNPDELRRLIGLNVIAKAFARAAALDPANPSLEAMSALYAGLAAESAARTSVRIDLDGDGEADAVRRVDTPVMVRG